jgi:hypothetical protein
LLSFKIYGFDCNSYYYKKAILYTLNYLPAAATNIMNEYEAYHRDLQYTEQLSTMEWGNGIISEEMR